MATTAEMTLEEARRIVEHAELLDPELAPYDMAPADIDAYRLRLWHDNEEATTAEVHEAVVAERQRVARQRKAQHDAQIRAAERDAHERRCRCCGKPAQQAIFVGTSERERAQGYQAGFRDHFCSDCRGPVAEEYDRRKGAELVDDKSRAQLAAEYFDALEALK